MRQSTFAVALLSAFSLPAVAQVISLPVLSPGGALAAVTTQVFSALPAPLTTASPLPVDATILENGINGSGVSQVLGLGSNNVTSSVIGNQLNNTLGTPLLGLPTGTAKPVDVAVLGGDGVGNSNPGGVAGVAVLSGHNVAHGGLVGLGILNRNNTGNGQLLGVAALSGTNSGNASQGLGIGLLNRGEALGVSAGGSRVLTIALVASQARGALPGLDQSGLAILGGKPVTSSNPLLNLGLLAGNNAGSGGMVGIAVLSGNNAANAQMIGVGVLNQDDSGKGLLGVDVLSGNGSGVSTNGLGVAVLSGNNSGAGSGAGVGALTGNNSGTGGMVGAGVLSGNGSGKSDAGVGVGALSGTGSGTGGATGANAVGSNTGAGNTGAANGGSGADTGAGSDGSTNGNGGVRNGGTSSAGGAYAYTSNGDSRVSARGAEGCKVGDKDAAGRVIPVSQCQSKAITKKI